MKFKQAMELANFCNSNDVNDSPNIEYLRGQVELLADMYPMGGEFHVENAIIVLHKMGANKSTIYRIYGEEGLQFYNQISK